jgi:hypothetical protein
MLGVCGMLFTPFWASSALILLFVARPPQGFFEWSLRLLLDEFTIGMALYFGLGFLWAISGSPRLNKVLDVLRAKIILIMVPLGVFGTVMCLVAGWL